MMYQSPRIAESEMADAYDLLEEYRHYCSMAEAKRRLFETRIGRFQREWKLSARGSFLDIGASHGFMLDAMRAKLPGWDLAAVDISPSARESLAARGYRTNASLDALDARARFDWINLDNVLEHMPDPVATVKSLRGRLKPGGFIYIDVPNESFFSVRYRINDAVRGFRKAPTFPGHVNLFTPATLKKIVAAAGYRCERFWLESVAAPGRLEGCAGATQTPRVETVLRFLRTTRMDTILRVAYYLCAKTVAV